jgi:iron complex outermembrane receptor protein
MPVSGFYNDVGGYIYNVATRRDVNGNKSWGLRGKLDWDATDTLNFLLSGDFRKSDALCCQSVAVALSTPEVIQLSQPIKASPHNRQIIDDSDSFNNERQYTVSLEGNLDLGAATLTSITAYQRYKNNSNNVVDRIVNPVPVYTGGNAWFNQNGGRIDLGQFSQELRLASNGASDLSYVAGGYYSNVTVDRDFLRRIATCAVGTLGQPCAAPTIRSVTSDAHNKSESIAGFGQLEYRVAGGFKLIGGLRVQHESTAVSGVRISPAIAGDLAVAGFASVSGRRSASDTAVTGKAGAQYEFSRNAQAYASYTRPRSSANGIWAAIPTRRVQVSTNGSASKDRAIISRPTALRQ